MGGILFQHIEVCHLDLSACVNMPDQFTESRAYEIAGNSTYRGETSKVAEKLSLPSLGVWYKTTFMSPVKFCAQYRT